jgi:hypothetical protein
VLEMSFGQVFRPVRSGRLLAWREIVEMWTQINFIEVAGHGLAQIFLTTIIAVDNTVDGFC